MSESESMLQRILLLPVLFCFSCAHTGNFSGSFIDSEGNIKLSVVPKVGRTEVTQYHSRAVSRVYKDSVLHKKSKDDLDFQVKTIIDSVDPMAKKIFMTVSSQNKSGEGDLHDFAIPEIGESLKLVVNDKAEILEAGQYPKDSIFYLPTIALPKDKVQIGDSWQIVVAWVTEKQKIPLKMELVSILKEIRPCDKDHCALIELDGEVALNAAKQSDLELKSIIRGFLYFSLEKGTVVWSHIRSDQEFRAADIENKFKSCLVSYVTAPETLSLTKKVNPFCDPESELTASVIP
jgi:hypothetical protein